jgi:two-component system, cell cycle sensor histidine kinase and response regulator CckA
MKFLQMTVPMDQGVSMTKPLDSGSARHLSQLVIDSDSQDIERTRAQKAYRLNVLQIPTLRLLGFSLLGIGALLHNLFLREPFSWASVVQLATILTLYPLCSWLTLYFFFARVKTFDLGSFFLVFDIFIYVLIVYFTGGDKSWLFFLVLSRVADHVNTSFRKVLLYAHISIGSYVLMLIYLMYVEHHAIAWLAEASKIAVLYGVSLYLALATRTVEQRHIRTSDAIRVARELIFQLEEQSKQLAASKSKVERLSRHNELILGSAGEGIYGLDLQGHLTFINPAAANMLGWAAEDVIGRPLHRILPPMQPEGASAWRQTAPDCVMVLDEAVHHGDNGVFWRKDGTSFPVEYTSTPIRENGALVGAVIVFKDITERKRVEEALHRAKDELEARVQERTAALANANEALRAEITERRRAEERLRESEEQYRLLFEANPHPMWVVDHETLAFLAVNDAAVRHYGYTRREFLAMSLQDLHPAENAPTLSARHEPLAHAPLPPGLDRAGMGRHRRKDETLIEVELTWSPISFQGRAAKLMLASDITDRKQLEDQLRQAQKMEAVGRLAGGVAHDFNNMLAVIASYSELLLRQLDPDSPLHRYADEIKQATHRTSTLTRQLLAFARRQVLQPQVLDLNAVVATLERMLRRLIGEDITLVAHLDPTLGQIRADPGQLEQVLLNLAINARDAMAQGGRLTLETANLELDDAYARQRINVRPGPYVMLAVSDTGCGMDAKTLSHTFEPFFTTKEPGQGTGLGLSTVYGIVTQSGGAIEVTSEPGRGTTFMIYLPRVADGGAVEPSARRPEKMLHGGETILVVEDEAKVRAATREILRLAGYRVLEAGSGEEAMRASERYAGPIHLLLSDMVMSGMSGPEVAQQLLGTRPAMKVLYMSGYPAEAIVHRGLEGLGQDFLQKPFTLEALTYKVREVLDADLTRSIEP